MPKYLTLRIMEEPNSAQQYELQGDERLRDVVERYLREKKPGLLNSGYTVYASTPEGTQLLNDINISVKDLIKNYGTDELLIAPGTVIFA